MLALDEPRIILGRQFEDVVALEADNRNARRIAGVAFKMDGQFGLHAADADARCDKPPRHLVYLLIRVWELKCRLPFCPAAARSFGWSGQRNVSGPPDADSAYGRRTAREKQPHAVASVKLPVLLGDVQEPPFRDESVEEREKRIGDIRLASQRHRAAHGDCGRIVQILFIIEE